MFVALEVAEAGSTGIFAGILNILTKPKARLETREAFGAVYGAVVAPAPVHDADWRRIADLAGRYGDRLLLPEGLIPPPPPLSEPRFTRFGRVIMLKTAVEIIKRTRMPMYRRIIGLVDENGEYADFLFPLLHHYTAVKVLTGQSGLYLAEAERMMHELGAPVLLCEDYASFADCVLIIAPDGVAASDKLSCPVLAGKPPESGQRSDFITDLEVIPKPELQALFPAGINPHKVMAALFEYCGVDEASAPAGRMTFRYARTDLSQVVLAVMEASGTLSIF